MGKEKEKRSPIMNWRFTPRGWGLMNFYLIALFFTTLLTVDSMQLALPWLAENYGWNQTLMLSWNTYAGYIGIAILVPIGIWAQKAKIGMRLQALILTLIFGIAFMLMGFSGTMAMFITLLAVVVCASNGLDWVSYARLTDAWFPRKKGLAMGYITMGNGIADICGLAIFSGLLVAGGIRLACLIMGILLVIYAFIAFAFTRNTPEECGYYPDNISPEQEEEFGIETVQDLENVGKGNWTLKGILSNKEFWIISLCCALMQCGGVAAVMYGIVRMEEFGIGENAAIGIIAALAALGLVGSIFWGWYDQKFSTKRAFIIFAIFYAIALLLNIIAAVAGHNVPVLMISMLMLYWCMGGTANWPVSLTATLFGRADFTKAMTPLTIIFSAGRCTGFLVVAFGIALTGGALTGAYIISIFLYIAAIILMLFLNVPKFLEKHPKA